MSKNNSNKLRDAATIGDAELACEQRQRIVVALSIFCSSSTDRYG